MQLPADTSTIDANDRAHNHGQRSVMSAWEVNRNTTETGVYCPSEPADLSGSAHRWLASGGPRPGSEQRPRSTWQPQDHQSWGLMVVMLDNSLKINGYAGQKH